MVWAEQALILQMERQTQKDAQQEVRSR
jgi:hypothetical protein